MEHETETYPVFNILYVQIIIATPPPPPPAFSFPALPPPSSYPPPFSSTWTTLLLNNVIFTFFYVPTDSTSRTPSSTKGSKTPNGGDRFIPDRSSTNFELGHYKVIC